MNIYPILHLTGRCPTLWLYLPIASKGNFHVLKFLQISTVVLCAWGTQCLAGNAPSGDQSMHFASAASYAKANILFQRMLLPRNYAALRSSIQDRKGSLDVFTVDPRNESWHVYMPQGQHSAAPGVLVWISDTDDGSLPAGWGQALDQANLIYVSADGAGAKADLIQERAALALNGLHGVTALHKVDSSRIYIGGTGSGAQAANRIALSFGDIFKGGLFIGGHPEIGTADSPLPTGGVLVFDTSNRYVMADIDQPVASNYAVSMRKACVSDVVILDHSTDAFDAGLQALNRAPAPQSGTASACLTKLGKQINQDIADIRKQLENGDATGAAKSWKAAYAQYGGLLGGGMDALGDQIAGKLSDTELTKFMHNSVFGAAKIPHFRPPKLNQPRPGM